MRSVPLGASDLEVTSVGLGTMNFGGRTAPDVAHTILDVAFDAGIRLIDTANVYGHDPLDHQVGRGRSESIIGDWLSRRRCRDEVVVATKMFFPMRDEPDALGATRRNVTRECEASLRRLQVDTIDLYQLHHPSNDIAVEETIGALGDLVTAGKVRHVGTSSFAAWQLVEACWVADTLGVRWPVSEQPVYNLLDRRIERELVGMTTTYGIGLLTWSPLAGGALAGVYRPDTPPPDGSRYAEFWHGRDQSLTADVHDALAAVAALAAERGMTPATFAQAWVMSRTEPASVLIGPRTVDRLDDALTASRTELDDDALAAIDLIAPPGRCVLPQYGADGLAWHPWGPHQHPRRQPQATSDHRHPTE